MNSEPNPRIFTIGHGNASFQEFERLLVVQGIATIVDVRSIPYSRFAPHFRRSPLSESTTAAGFGYRWMGDRLGGQPPATDQTGAPAIEVGSPSFRGAIAEVIALNKTGPVALLCAERDPEHCHRRVVLAPQFETAGLAVFHILPDGSAHRHQASLGI
jgi:uncharacterized protein (DUF488 family)